MHFVLATRREGATTVVHVSGSLGADGVPLLRDLLAGTPRAVAIDLAELIAASAEGIAELRRARAAGIEIGHASPYIALRMAEEPHPTHSKTLGQDRTEGDRA